MAAYSTEGLHPPVRSRRHPRLPVGAVALAAGLLLTVLAAALVGCGSADGGEPATTPDTPDAGDSLGMLAPPGLYDQEDGRTQALGVLAYQDLEGGFWAVMDALPAESVEGAAVVAVLVGVEDLGIDLEALRGRFVVADGVLLDGASIRMAGPELQVDSLQEATDTVVITTDTTG